MDLAVRVGGAGVVGHGGVHGFQVHGDHAILLLLCGHVLDQPVLHQLAERHALAQRVHVRLADVQLLLLAVHHEQRAAAAACVGGAALCEFSCSIITII